MQEKIFDVGDYMLDKVLDNNNSNNVCFNAIIPAGRVWQF